jgi:branched-chain amino acid transport system substrate-binding protein
MADAIRFVLKDHGYRAGAFAVGYQSCDDSTAQTGDYELRKCAANANAYAGAADVVAVIGPFNSRCAQVEIPILNRAPHGSLAIVSASNTFPNLTRGGRLALPPPVGVRGEPEAYYPSGERNYARVISRDDLEGVALAVVARRLGLNRVYLLYDKGEAGWVSWTDPFRRTAARLGVGIAGPREYAEVRAPRALASTVARSGADGVLLGGLPRDGQVLRALRARLGKDVTIMAGNEFSDIPRLLEVAGAAARGLYVATTQLPADGFELTPAAVRFTREFGSAAYGDYVLQAAQAAEVVLAAIRRSDGTRASVLRQLHATRVENGLVGSFGFDRNGDMTPGKVAILRVTGATPPNLHLPPHFQGAVVDSLETVPAELSG